MLSCLYRGFALRSALCVGPEREPHGSRRSGATLPAWLGASFSVSTTHAIGNAAAIPTAGAGERRWAEPSSGGFPAATSGFITRIALSLSGSEHRTQRRSPLRYPLLGEDHRGDRLSGILLEPRHHVRVGIEREADGRVAEALTHNLRVHASLQRERGPCVAQIVQADRSNARSPDVGRESIGHPIRVQGWSGPPAWARFRFSSVVSTWRAVAETATRRPAATWDALWE
jgi:hypothetical protein